MLGRCRDKGNTSFPYYGGKGISVCEEWVNSPQAFLDWAGENGYERGLQLDRIDTTGNYAPSNCRFVTAAENNQNRISTKCTADIARDIRKSLRMGATIKEAANVHKMPYQIARHIARGYTWKGFL
jgi:hypothetical protein